MVCISLMFAVGCTEQQLTDANSVLSAAGDALQTPAAELIPQPFKLGSEVVVGLAGAILAGWLNRKKNLYKKAITETVDGVDTFLHTDDNGNAELKTALNAAQSIDTKQLVKGLKT